MTALDYIKDALRLIGVIGETETPSAEQGAFGVSKLNDLMAELEECGIELGYAPVSATTDTVTLPAGHRAGIKAQLAVEMASNYGAEIPLSVASANDESRRRLGNQAIILAMKPADSGLPMQESGYSAYEIGTG